MRRFRALLAWYLFGLVAPAGGANRSFEGGVLCTGSRQELYSAAWIASTAMLAAFPIDRARLQRPGTGMEGATLILMELTHNQRVFKSVDLLELFMEHLSWYERDLRFFRAADERGVTRFRERVRSHARALAEARLHHPAESGPPLTATVAVMPFYAAGRGSGNSEAALRVAYLEATLLSLRAQFTRVVVSVCDRGDLATLAEVEVATGVGLYDVLFQDGLVNPDKLGAASLFAIGEAVRGDDRAAAARRAGSMRRAELGWELDALSSVYYTESDQILYARHLREWVEIALASPLTNLVFPHRIVPLPLLADVAPTPVHSTARAKLALRDAMPIERLSRANLDATRCCFPTFEHVCKNKLSAQRNLTEGALFRYDAVADAPASFAMVAGEGNFWKKHFRFCDFRRDGSGCPRQCTEKENACPGHPA